MSDTHNSDHYLATVCDRVARGALSMQAALRELEAAGQMRGRENQVYACQRLEDADRARQAAQSAHRAAEIEAEMEAGS